VCFAGVAIEGIYINLIERRWQDGNIYNGSKDYYNIPEYLDQYRAREDDNSAQQSEHCLLLE
jgi:hypothetical protein